jgi:DNA-binding response OmpR family regulator
VVNESPSTSHEVSQPLHLGVVALSDCESRRLLSIITSTGWSVVKLNPADEPAVSWTSVDVVVISTRRITADVLAIVSAASQHLAIPLLVVSRDKGAQQVADALRSGADDYVVTPMAVEELVARIRALVKRSPGMAERRAESEIEFNHVTRTVLAGPLQMSLSQREWDVLCILLESESRLVTVEALSESLTGDPHNETIVISTVSRLRKKIRASQFSAISIETVYGRGYVARFRRVTDTYGGRWRSGHNYRLGD